MSLNRCLKKSRNTHRKTPVFESLLLLLTLNAFNKTFNTFRSSGSIDNFKHGTRMGCRS